MNIVPAECTVEFELRDLPTVVAATMFARIRREAKQILVHYARFEEANITIEETGIYPELNTPD